MHKYSLRYIFLSGVLIFSTVVLSAQIKVNVNAEPVRKALKQIEQTSDYRFFYEEGLQSLNGNITLSIESSSIDVVLKKVFENTDLEFRKGQENIIVISRRNPQNKPKATEKTVQGSITGEDGVPIAGASVMIKGTTQGVITDADGKFSMTVGDKDVLQVSYMSYHTEEVAVSDKTFFAVTLKEDSQQLDEVVIVGYGTQKKSDITGSVTSVKTSELLSSPKAGAIESLQGRAAGVVVQNNSGDPSGTPTIRIRGANSLTYGNSPLIIIDGVQDANLASLNPNQIESFQILKDAAALSIYGSRGANGVILVTTKTGSAGKPLVSYNGFVSFDQVRRKLPSLNAQEFASVFETAQRENGLPSIFNPEQIAQLGNGTNWQDEIFRNAVSHNHNLSISGTKNNTSYFIALTLTDKQGIILNSGFQEYTLRTNLKTDVTNWLNIQFTNFSGYNSSLNGSIDQAIAGALQWDPTKPVYSEDGKYSLPGGGVGPNDLYNPVGYTKEITTHNTNISVNSSLSAEVKFCEFLKFSSLVAFNIRANTSGFFDNQIIQQGPSSDVYGHKTQGRYWSLQNTNILSFDKDFDGHHVQATAVYELLKDNYQSTWVGSKGIPVGLGYNGVSFGTTFQQPWIEYTNTAMMSFMGRVNYAYRNRYLFSGSLRYDGASQLAKGNKFNLFGAVSVGWNLMEESFMAELKNIIPEFKIRASLGSVGNAAVPAYASQMKFSPGLDANNFPTLTVSQLANKDLRWERTNEFNVGVDSRFINNRIVFSIEYYSKKTNDLLMWKKVPVVLGGSGSLLTNVGAVSNQGFDLSVGGLPVVTQDFSWNINYVMNYNDNKILALDGLSDVLVYESGANYPGLVGSFVQMVGQPMGTFLGLEYLGVWQLEEAYEANRYGLRPGDAKYTDRNKDYKIDDSDITVIGNAQPKITYGINNTFSYKGFDLNIFLQGVWGNQIYNQNRIRRESYAGTTSPTSPVALDHWTRENPSNVPAFSGQERINSSRWVESGAYLRLKNVTLGYRFPEKWLSKIYVKSLRLYVSGTNLMTFTKYTGYDPEASMGSDAVAAGVDRGIYPASKNFLIGIDLTF